MQNIETCNQCQCQKVYRSQYLAAFTALSQYLDDLREELERLPQHYGSNVENPHSGIRHKIQYSPRMQEALDLLQADLVEQGLDIVDPYNQEETV